MCAYFIKTSNAFIENEEYAKDPFIPFGIIKEILKDPSMPFGIIKEIPKDPSMPFGIIKEILIV